MTIGNVFLFLALLAHAAPVIHAGPVPQAKSSLAVSRNYPDPERCIGACDLIHDPNIVYEDNTYWRFTTSRNISIATAPFLEGPWTYKGSLLLNGTSINLHDNQDIWAPSVFSYHSTWYAHYSVSFIGSQHSEIGVATSPSLAPGTWTDHGAMGLPQNARYNLIDPHVFQEEDPAKPLYFTFGSYWSGIQQIVMDDHAQLKAWAGEQQAIKTVISNTTERFAVVEGATMHKHEGFYYMFYSVGQCCRAEFELVPPGDEYHVVVCRGESITGLYFDKEGKDCLTQNGGTTVLASHGDIYAPGGQGVMIDPKSERTVMYYHYGKSISNDEESMKES
ncbi:endo-1,5-alpha-L-arabinosidase [Ophiobolus disseminans]|uniref:Arabinan endo-1,5-alpha-L-arabinosidase n=1 Tax=Ophiobolus disseminans TaxID=1469910 RepID=A0A6A6ZBF9_9PLEO|nr:endo-1,5-alpha-L-arabinosidase [Ophiobolus disseminans]